MNGISTKLSTGSLAGAVTGVIIWSGSLIGIYVPGEVGAYLAIIVSFAIGWLVKEKRIPAPTPTIALADTPETPPAPTRPAIDLPTIPQP